MNTSQVLVILTICFSLMLISDQLLISEACGVTQDKIKSEATESSQAFGKGLSEIFAQAFFQKAWQDGVVKKLILPLRLTAIVSTTATAVAWSKYSTTHKDYMNARDMDKISEYYDRSNKYYKLRNGLIVATGILWGANLVTLWLKPPPEVDEFASLTGEMSNIASARWKIPNYIESGLNLSWSGRF